MRKTPSLSSLATKASDYIGTGQSAVRIAGSSQARPTSPVSPRTPVPMPGGATTRTAGQHQRRPFTSKPVFDVLRRSPWHDVVAGNVFRFQAPDDCLTNVGSMQAAALASLQQRGLLDRRQHDPAWTDRLQSIWQGDKHLATQENPSALDVEATTHQHGPCRLMLSRLPPDHESDYSAHAMLVLGTFRLPEGKVMGVVVDGDDSQKNPVVDAIADPLKPLADFSPQDFASIQTRLDATGAGLNAHQVIYRIIDIEDCLASGRHAHAGRTDASLGAHALQDDHTTRPQNSIQYRTDFTVTTAFADAAMQQELAAAVS